MKTKHIHSYFFLLAGFLIISFQSFSQSYSTIGTGTNALNYPYNTSYHDAKTQIVYTATELQSSGMEAGRVDNIAFKVNTFSNSPMNNFQIKIQNTNIDTLTSFIDTNWTTVYSNTHSITKAGWDTLVFNNNFVWDGFSNLLIQVCFDNNTYSSNSRVYGSSILNKVWYQSLNGGSGCALGAGSTLTVRPNILFGVIKPVQTDIGIISFTQPDLNYAITPNASVPIEVQLVNYGTVAQNSFDIKYSIDNGTTFISETHTTSVAPGDTFQHTFTQNADMTNEGYYNFVGVVTLANDSNLQNDTIRAEAIVCASMSGTYTVGSGMDYPNIGAAINSIKSCGVSGPVEFQISNGTYDGQYTIDSIAGASKINTITFKGQGDNTILTYAASNTSSRHIFKLDGAKHIIIDDLKLLKLNTTDYFVGVWLLNQADSNIIRNCKIDIPYTGQYNYGILSSSTSDYANYANNANYLLIENNEIIGGFQGIALGGTSTLIACNNNTIKNNYLYNQKVQGITLIYQGNVVVDGNIVEDGSNTQDYGYGFDFRYCRDSIEINSNTIKKNVQGDGMNLLELNQNYSTNSNVFITNNMISMHNNTSYTSTGIKNTRSSNIKFYNNTINIVGSNNNSYALYLTDNSDDIIINNNILSSDSGYAIYTDLNDTNFTSNYNNLYTKGTKLCYINGEYNTLALWQGATNGDANSLSISPEYYSDIDLHSTSSAMDNTGTPLTYVQFDIDGDARNMSTPDMGADEYTPPANDIEIIGYLGINNQSCGLSNNEVLSVIVHNNGTNNQTSINLSYKVNNNSINTEIMSLLNANETDTFPFINTADLSAGGISKITFWSDLANDEIRQNDTIKIEVENTLKITSFPFNELFEDTNFYFQLHKNNDADIRINDNNGFNYSKCIYMLGGDYDGWLYYGSDLNQIISQNYSHKVSAETCDIDATSMSVLSLSFKLKMQNSNPNENWFYVTANDNIIKDINGDSVWHSTSYNYIDLQFDLSSNLGGQLHIDLIGIPKSSSDDQIYIDNINLYQPQQNDVGVTNVIALNSGSCGSLTDSVFAIIKNFGTLEQTNIPINIDIVGSANVNLSTTYTDTLFPDVVDTIFVGTFNSTLNGWLNTYSYTSLSTDTVLNNDSLVSSFYNFRYHTQPHIEDFNNMNGTGNANNTWELQQFIFQDSGYFGLTSNALLLDVYQQSTQQYAIFKENIGIIDTKSILNFDFRLINNSSFNDTINFKLTNCSGAESIIYSIYPSTIINDNLWHYYSIPIGQFAGDKVRISVEAISVAGSTYSIAIDNFGIMSSFDLNIGNDTLICFNDSLLINPELSSDSGYHFVWQGPNVMGDTTETIYATQAGVYSVIVNNNSGVINHDTLVLTYTPEITHYTTATDTNICNGDSTFIQTTFNGSFPMIVDWKAGNIFNSDTTYSVLNGHYSPQTNTIFRIYLITDNNGCTVINDDSLEIVVNDLPTITMNSDKSEYCSNDMQDTVIASPMGGSFTGSVSSEGLFNPNSMYIGNHTIIYEYTDNNNCTNNDTLNITINSSPNAYFINNPNPSYCINGDSIKLESSIAGGSYNGPGLTGDLIYLDSTSVGLKEYTYLYTDINGCIGADTIQIQLNANPTTTLVPFDDVCENQNSLSLVTGTPAGGTYSGAAVSTSVSEFYPSAAGIGDYVITYTFTDTNGCKGFSDAQIKVRALPNASFFVDATICKSDTTTVNYSISTGPSASFIWDFNNANIISGSNQGPYELAWDTAGVKYLSLILTDSGCTNSYTTSTIIQESPTTIFSTAINSSYCKTSDTITLDAYPTGGQVIGNGIWNNMLYLDSVNAGSQQYIYKYTNNNGCIGRDTINININDLPIVSLGALSDACQNETNIALTTGTPAGGNYFGNAVSTGTSEFYPGIAIIGLNNITYKFIDNNGCVGESSTFIRVVSTPMAIFSSDASICKSDTGIINYSANVGASANFIWDFNNANIISGSNQGPYELGWDTAGVKYLTLILTDSGCTNSYTTSTVILDNPMVNFSASISGSYCKTSDTIALDAFPTGGQVFGNGITNSMLFLDSVNTGSQQYIYKYTNNDGCIGTDTIDISINSLPIVSLGTLSDACQNEASIALTTGTPTGGNYFGNAVSTATSEFYPGIANIGLTNIIYKYIDNNGCEGESSSFIRVVSTPLADFTTDANICRTYTANINYSASASPSAIFNWNFDNANIISGAAQGPYQLSWDTAGMKNLTLSVSDSNCTSTLFYNFTNVLEATASINLIGNDSACYGEDVILFTNSSYSNSYQWFDTSGNIANSNDTLSYFAAMQSGLYFVRNTNSNGCFAFSDSIDVTVSPEIISDFTLPTIACINDMVNVDYSGYSQSTGVFTWDFDNGVIASGSNYGPYNIIWNTDSIKNIRLTVEDNGCTSVETTKPINIQTTVASITALGSTSFCEGGSVTLSANAGPYTYEWFKDGVSASNTQALYSVSQAGVYTVMVTNNNTTCSNISDSIVINVNTTDFNITYTADQTSFSTPPFEVNFTNSTLNANDYYWMWSFGDGSSSTFVNPSHLYNYDGDYTVGLIAQNVNTGCFDTLVKNDYINCTGGSPDPCNLDPTFNAIGGNEVCPDDSVKFSANEHTTGITYQWLRDGILISGATDSVYFATTSGLYQLMVADATCSMFSQPFPLNQFTTIQPSILENGDIQPCTNDSMELYVSTSFSAYQWSSGQNTPNIYIQTSGSYIVTVTDNNGCNTTSEPLVINASLLEVPDICIVGIDTATNHNRVIWERQTSAMIDSFRIYRESNVSGVYDLIGSQPFSTLSVFEDVNSNPAQMAYRYRITAVDTCGMETAPSPIHKTLHLQINTGLGGVWNLAWTFYEGFDFGSYKIYRSSDSTGLELLTQIQNNLTTYTDLNPPAGNVFYQIEVVSPHPCYPDSIYTKENTNYNSSRSNTANTANATNNTGLFNYINNNIEASIYPNPNNGLFTLEIGDIGNYDMQLSIINTVGTEVYNDNFSIYGKTRKQIDLKGLARGVYFISLKTPKGIAYRGKVIIN